MTSHGEWLPKITKAPANVNYFSIPEGKHIIIQNQVETTPSIKMTLKGNNKEQSPIKEDMTTLAR